MAQSVERLQKHIFSPPQVDFFSVRVRYQNMRYQNLLPPRRFLARMATLIQLVSWTTLTSLILVKNSKLEDEERRVQFNGIIPTRSI